MILRNLFLILSFLAVFSGGVMTYVHATETVPNYFELEIENYLNNNVQSNAMQIENHMNEIENDVLFLANSPRVKNMLKSETASSMHAAKIRVDKKIEIISKEVENYILNNPKMNLIDLQNSIEFQNIAIQKIGIDGYSLIIDSETSEIFFHTDKNLNSLSIEDFLSNEEIILIIKNSLELGNGSGYYNEIYYENKSRIKYANFKKINVKTNDGISFIVGVTANVDEYQTIKNLSAKDDYFLKNLTEINNYRVSILYNDIGHVIYMTDESLDFGLNLKLIEGGIYKESLDIVERAGKDKAIFNGLFNVDNYIFISFAASVYEDDKFLGIIEIHKEIDDINKILKDSIPAGKSSENYIIDENGILITPLGDVRLTPFVQEINTEITKECLEDFKKIKESNMSTVEYERMEDEGEIHKFENYRGDIVIGQEFPIESTKWCLLSEISLEEVLNIPRKIDEKREIITQGGVFIIAIFLIIFSYFKIPKNYYIVKKKWSKVNPILIKYMEGKKRFLIPPFLAVSTFSLIHISIIGLKNIINNFVFTIHDLNQIIFLTISFTMIIYSDKIKSEKGKWIFISGILFLIYNVLSILTYLYFNIENPAYLDFFIFMVVFKSLGVISLIMYFRGNSK